MKIVGWHDGETGTQYCVECVPNEVADIYPIEFGHPDWSYGSVPVCKICRKEITTIGD